MQPQALPHTAEGVPVHGETVSPRPGIAGVALLALTLSWGARASADPVTLSSAFETAKRENARIVSARNRLTAARADSITAGLLPNPTLDVGALGFTHGGAITGGREELTFGLAQQLPIFGSLGLRREAAEQFASAEEREAAETVWQTLCDVKSAYLELQLAQAKVRVYEVARGDLDRAYAIIQERVSGGANPKYDRARIAIERGNLSTRLADAEVERSEARIALTLAVGGTSLKSREVSAEGVPSAPVEAPGDVNALVATALTRRPSARAAELRIESSKSTVSYYSRARMPVPELRLAYGRYLRVPGADSSGGAVLGGINLPLPLFDRNQGRIDRAEAEVRIADSERGALRRQIQLDVERAHAELEIRVRAWRTFKGEITSEVASVRQAAEMLYKEGRSSVLELLDAYRAFLESEERGLELRSKAVQASFDLERAVGPASTISR